MIIKEDDNNIYILNYVIPKSNSKENFKKREQIIWSIYGKWQAEKFNTALVRLNNKKNPWIYTPAYHRSQDQRFFCSAKLQKKMKPPNFRNNNKIG